ncbi:class I SAM-dependent methyltransferase [Phenylobacterium sp.]|uniref:class I SAM-dependent methyltransferase n=1 Tax=Phenylobacterium sp. TaxID=1871053 RepID=UPI002DE94E72|nr:class I SAM-dependent methyltransferase [Phenylobacterium sp.]
MKRALPPAVRQLGRTAYEFARGSLVDAAEWASGRRRPLTPPRRLWHLIGSGRMDFHGSGDLLREWLIEQGMTPDDRVLDVGCGLGRLAVALSGYLSPRGGYDGFDIMPPVIAWCRRAFAAYPNFRFQLVDVKSRRYRKGGAAQASAFVFPYADSAFDLVFLGSVFTHLMPDDMANYLGEVARVMKPGARCAISYYLMSPTRRAEVERGGGVLSFRHRGDGYWAEDASLPEAAIAYDDAEIAALFEALGLEIVARYDGQWSTAPLHSQDVLIGRKL